MNTSVSDNSNNKITYGLNTPFFLQHDSNWPKVEIDYLIDSLLELGVEQVRIPLSWFHMVTDHSNSKLLWNNAFVDLYAEFLGALPKTISVLGVPLHPPRKIAREYFYDQQSITGPFLEFLAAVNRAFPVIRDWEIWNEPNAGDFYLSVKDKNGHRPWRADEFIEHLLMPAAKFLKSQDNAGLICAPGFAENGIVGHKDREKVLSNRLPKTDEFRAMQPNSGHGHFYFIPKFANEFLEQLSQKLQNEPKLIDAIAYHPYPYWQIYTRKNKSLVESTHDLASDFSHLVKKHNLNELEIWITEVGARSLEMANQNQRNDIAQEQYLDGLYNKVLSDTNASRIYWYKLIDKSFDLKQEKTFGLLDIWGNRKKSYYKLKSIQRQQKKSFNLYVDTFKYTADHDQGELDPNDWERQQSDNFGYCIPSDKKSFSGVMVYPGKGEKAFISWVNKFSFKKENSQSAVIKLDLDRDVYPAGACLSFVLHDVSNHLQFLKVSYAFFNDEVLVSLSVKCNSTDFAQDSVFSFKAYPNILESVFISWNKEQVVVGLTANETRFYQAFELNTVQFPRIYGLKLNVENSDNSKSFVALSNLKILAEEMSPQFNILPNNDQHKNTWTADKSPYSQIDQDEWVLRATNYKRNGFFVEVGGHDGISNSNTVLLERKYDWTGFIVEANPRHYRQVCYNRNCVSFNYAVFPEAGEQLEFVDAGAVGGLLSHLQDDIHTNFRQRAIDENRIIRVPSETLNALLERSGAPELIEFMSVDTEGSELEVLHSCDFNKWKIALLTVEHGGVESKRKQVLKYLEMFGYQRERVWFEDWYYHPQHLKKINNEDESQGIKQVFDVIPVLRKKRLADAVIPLLRKNDQSEAEKLLKELIKDFYPDNSLAHAQYIELLMAQNKFQLAVDLLNNGMKKFPRNQLLLKLGIQVFSRECRIVLLIRCIEGCIKFSKGILQDKEIVSLIKANQNQMLEMFEHHPTLQKNNPGTVNYLKTKIPN